MPTELPEPFHPDRPPRFRSDQELRNHVEVHVIDLKKRQGEEWEEILGEKDIRKAREELRQGEWWGEATQRLSRVYEAFAGAELQAACTFEDRHAHYRGYKPRNDDDTEVRLDTEMTLLGWWDDSRILWIVAGSSVRNSKWKSYFLRSMYRFKREPTDFHRRLKLHGKLESLSERGLVQVECRADGGSLGRSES